MWSLRGFIGVFLLVIKISFCSLVPWERLRCAPDPKQEMPEGAVDDIGRFPWLGIVQHNFYIAGRTHFAITGAVLIHPAFAIAPAEDIAKLNPEELTNNTKLILWSSRKEKYALDVKDYTLHPQYKNKVTFATIALLDLVGWRVNVISEWQAPVLPICMPIKGFGTYTNLYAVKMSDETGKIEKEILKMSFVDDQTCKDFYDKAQLTYKKMNPVNPICAVSEKAKKPCVWDGGAALISKQSWGYWKLIGFAVRGPGCGAPTKFLNVHDYLPWINDVISQIPLEDYQDMYKLVLRRVSPNKLIMYNADANIPISYGQCDRKSRGKVLYKANSEILINKNFAQGFFHVVITQMAEFLCAEVSIEAEKQTHAAVWMEHSCHRDQMGQYSGVDRPDVRKAYIQVTLYGKEESFRNVPNPFHSSQHTTNWWPTPNRLRTSLFVPVNSWWYNM